MLSSGSDMAAGPMHSRHLWLPAQGEACQQVLARSLSSVRTYWLLRKKESFIFHSVAHCRFHMRERIMRHPRTCEQH